MSVCLLLLLFLLLLLLFLLLPSNILVLLPLLLLLPQWSPGPVKPDQEDRLVKRRNAFSLSHIKDSLKTCFKKRPDSKRFYLLLYFGVMLTIYLPFFGEFVISYSYVRTRL